MSDPCQLKCRFCEQEFNSTYKVIPHIFFGHHKKIFKRISKKEPLMYECPGGCDFKVSVLKYFKPGEYCQIRPERRLYHTRLTFI